MLIFSESHIEVFRIWPLFLKYKTIALVLNIKLKRLLYETCFMFIWTNLNFTQSIFLNEKQSMCACFSLETWLNKFYHTSDQMGISCIKCVMKEFWKPNTQNSQSTQFLKYFKYLSPTNVIIKYCHWVFCIKFSVAMETVNPKIWC